MDIEEKFYQQHTELAKQQAAIQRMTAWQQELRKTDRREIARKSDIELSNWQTSYPPESPQYRLAEYKWQRRLI
ncbi:MAG: hypothetical protein ABSB84_04080 [Verrucomicrobiota bacterium]|jgi:hypothetical protein